jgi:S1-C subfamily serine protease
MKMKKSLPFLILALIAYNSNAQNLSSEEDYKRYFKENINNLEPIEGIWSTSGTEKLYDQDNRLINSQYGAQISRLAIIKQGDYYSVTNVDGSYRAVETKFYNTATEGIYLYEQYFKQSYSTAKANVVMTGSGFLEYSYEVPSAQLKYDYGRNYQPGFSKISQYQYIKIFPTPSDYPAVRHVSSGTGFAISTNGFIVTNHHVIEGATSVKIKGINGDFSTSLNAKIVADDKANDLALLKITDLKFHSNGSIPYILSYKTTPVGSDVYALGYPLRATMGDEVKLTNGIISANSGFEGSLNQYQISVPLQPGNSGGPLISSTGSIIGIVNAKHLGTENVSYAIKSSFLSNLIESSGEHIILPQANLLTGKTLSQQVQLVKKCVYIIEVE